MGSRVKRNRDKTINRMLDKKISVAEARRRYGGKFARKAATPNVVKAQQARGSAGLDAVLAGMAAELAPRRPVTEADILEAVRAPMAVPSPAKAEKRAGTGAPGRRETPQALKAAGEMQAQALMMYAAPRVPAMSSWTGAEREMWRLAHEHHDPREREAYRATLEKELAGPGQGAATNVGVLTWGSPGGGPGWQALMQPPAPGLRIAPPGTAGR